MYCDIIDIVLFTHVQRGTEDIGVLRIPEYLLWAVTYIKRLTLVLGIIQ